MWWIYVAWKWVMHCSDTQGVGQEGNYDGVTTLCLAPHTSSREQSVLISICRRVSLSLWGFEWAGLFFKWYSNEKGPGRKWGFCLGLILLPFNPNEW